MIESLELEEKIKKNKLDKCYLFCGPDEQLIKEAAESIINKVVDKAFENLNYIQFDGTKVMVDDIINACETLPFMSEKKAVLVYRASFLEDGEEREQSKRFEAVNKYLQDLPDHCVLIMYYTFKDDREKPSNRLKKLEKKACAVKFSKLKGMTLEKKVKGLFEERGKEIGKVELKLFCDSLENNSNIMINEVEKLCCYTIGRDISKEDVLTMIPPKTDNDIFDLVDAIAQKKFENALSILNELIYKGEKMPYILFMIERQFKLLFNIKLSLEGGKTKDTIVYELRLNPYICDKMITQSKKFNLKQLKRAMELCLDTEETMKSSSVNAKTEMELLIVSAVI